MSYPHAYHYNLDELEALADCELAEDACEEALRHGITAQTHKATAVSTRSVQPKRSSAWWTGNALTYKHAGGC